MRGIVHRLNAEPGAVTVKPSEFLARLDEVQSRGYAIAELEDGSHMTAVVVPFEDGEPLALGVVEPGPDSQAGVEQTVKQLRRAVSANIGLSTAPEEDWSNVA